MSITTDKKLKQKIDGRAHRIWYEINSKNMVKSVNTGVKVWPHLFTWKISTLYLKKMKVKYNLKKLP